MTQHEIEQQDIIERYVRHQLPTAERRAFQEHYFACDECFAAVESTAKFIAGVQRSSRVGALSENAREVANTAVAPWWSSFFNPAFALGAAACLLLAVAVGWMLFNSSAPQNNTAQKGSPTTTPAPSPTPQTSPTTTQTAAPTPKDETPKREDLDNKLARNEPPTPRPNLEPKGSLVVDLETQRGGGQKSSTKLAPEIATLSLRAEVEPNRTIIYQIEIMDSGGRIVQKLSNVRASASGALAVSVPAKSFAAGKYTVKLYRLKNQQRELAGNYEMTLRN
jgi:hypothetical protein